MKAYTVELSDDVARRLEEYAEARRQSQEEAIAALLADELLHIQQRPNEEIPIGVNPLEKYIGRWVAKRPELSHDEFLAQEALGERDGDEGE